MARRVSVEIDLEYLVARRGFARLAEASNEFRKEAVADIRLAQSAMDDMAESTRRAGLSTGNMNNILFETGDLIQDLQFGLRGAGNNIAFLAEQIAQASTQGGGFRSVLTGIRSSLWGVGGVILGIQALIAAGPSLISMFEGSADAAERFNKAAEESMGDLLTFQTGTREFQVTPENAPQFLRVLTQRRASLEAERQGLQQRLRAARANIGPTGGAGEEQRRTLEGRISTLDRQIQRRTARIERIQQLLFRVAETRGLEEAFLEAGIQPTGAAGGVDRPSGTSPLFQAGAGQLIEGGGVQFPSLFALLNTEGRRALFGGGGQPSREFPSLLSLLNAQGRQGLLGVGRVDAAVGRRAQFGAFGTGREFLSARARELQNSLKQLREAGVSPTAETVVELRDALNSTREQMDEMGEQTENTSDVVSRLGETAVLAGANALAGIFERGANAAERMRSAVRGLVQTIGNQFIRAAFSGGIGSLSGFATGGLGFGLTALSGLFHEGTGYYPGGVGLVGERGPELVRLPQGAQIEDAMATRRALRSQQVTGGGAGADNAEVVQAIRELPGRIGALETRMDTWQAKRSLDQVRRDKEAVS